MIFSYERVIVVHWLFYA